ncbi:PP2C family protein-serine/threonine phosphatase [Pseudonocardia charpentierae]|uniref:SpoIIE family protein phosphatase n=1 Tax=Pseudonocardia charpentierae TaxID=3075545 RepID=A0ABU2NGZ6_9PSEU|nr:SpoIIE family protein phosphatase [Pseudonocardia sp. DSM 45834]MDT0353225.1 SpoIIE family protein phosphatase [Pseudonocardia sp. DSM 45834]
MCRTGPDAVEEPCSADCPDARFSALLEDSMEDLYEYAPCGYLSTLLDGTIAKINATLLGWLGLERAQVVGVRRFADLLTVGGRLYHETHFAPLLRMQGEINGVALELAAADGRRLPVLVTSTLKTGTDGEPLLIRTTVVDASERRAYERELLAARREADLERDRLARLAATLQRTLLPPALPVVPGLEVAAHYHPASTDEVGGDFYDLFRLDDGRWGLFIGDVCGNGAGAAVVTSLARYTLRAAAVHDPDPVAVLTELNAALHRERLDPAHRFCSVVFGVLTPGADGCGVVLATGGHPPPVVIRSDGTAEYGYDVGGQVVGLLPEASFVATALHLGPGDTLLLYTDGLSEARVDRDTRFDEDDLLEFLASQAPASASHAVAAVRGLLDGFGPALDDDTALLVVGVPASAQ